MHTPAIESPITYDSFKLQKVRAFDQRFGENTGEASQSEPLIFCPKHILEDFQTRFRNHPILGKPFWNPYINQYERFPANAANLSARHLHLLSRNEYFNTDGKIYPANYGGYLTEDEIATIRCLVRETVIAGLTSVSHRGGYGSPRVELPKPESGILIDQIGLQWQGDYRNTGGLFFYPNNPKDPKLPEGYSQWQAQVYHSVYQKDRPTEEELKNCFKVTWNGVEGVLDADGLRNSFISEFKNALLVTQYIAEKEGLNAALNFLKAGLGFFNSGLMDGQPAAHPMLAIIRLQAIKEVLKNTKNSSIANITALALPYSDESSNVIGNLGDPQLTKKISALLEEIKSLVEDKNALNKNWKGSSEASCISPPKGSINAETNCADNAGLQGNEGDKENGKAASVDGMKFFEYDLRNYNPGLNTGILACNLTCLLEGKPFEFFPSVQMHPEKNDTLEQCECAIFAFDQRASLSFLKQFNKLNPSEFQTLLKNLTTDGLNHAILACLKYLKSEFKDEVSVNLLSEYSSAIEHTGQNEQFAFFLKLNLIVCILKKNKPFVSNAQYYQNKMEIINALPEQKTLIETICKDLVKSEFLIESRKLVQHTSRSETGKKVQSAILAFINQTDLNDPDTAYFARQVLEKFYSSFKRDDFFSSIDEHYSFIQQLEKLKTNDTAKTFLKTLSFESLEIQFDSSELKKKINALQTLHSGSSLFQEKLAQFSQMAALNTNALNFMSTLHELVELSSLWLLTPQAKSSSDLAQLDSWATRNAIANPAMNTMVVTTLQLIMAKIIDDVKPLVISLPDNIQPPLNAMLANLEKIVSLSTIAKIAFPVRKIVYTIKGYISNVPDILNAHAYQYLLELNNLLNDDLQQLKTTARKEGQSHLNADIKILIKILDKFLQANPILAPEMLSSDSSENADNPAQTTEQSSLLEMSEEKILFERMKKGDVEAARQFIDKGYDTNTTDLDFDSNTPLKIVLYESGSYPQESPEYKNYQKIARMLILAGALEFPDLLADKHFLSPPDLDNAILTGEATDVVYALKKQSPISNGFAPGSVSATVTMLRYLSNNIHILTDDQYQNYQKIARLLAEKKSVTYYESGKLASDYPALEKIFKQLQAQEPRQAMVQLLHPEKSLEMKEKPANTRLPYTRLEIMHDGTQVYYFKKKKEAQRIYNAIKSKMNPEDPDLLQKFMLLEEAPDCKITFLKKSANNPFGAYFTRNADKKINFFYLNFPNADMNKVMCQELQFARFGLNLPYSAGDVSSHGEQLIFNWGIPLTLIEKPGPDPLPKPAAQVPNILMTVDRPADSGFPYQRLEIMEDGTQVYYFNDSDTAVHIYKSIIEQLDPQKHHLLETFMHLETQPDCKITFLKSPALENAGAYTYHTPEGEKRFGIQFPQFNFRMMETMYKMLGFERFGIITTHGAPGNVTPWDQGKLVFNEQIFKNPAPEKNIRKDTDLAETTNPPEKKANRPRDTFFAQKPLQFFLYDKGYQKTKCFVQFDNALLNPTIHIYCDTPEKALKARDAMRSPFRETVTVEGKYCVFQHTKGNRENPLCGTFIASKKEIGINFGNAEGKASALDNLDAFNFRGMDLLESQQAAFYFTPDCLPDLYIARACKIFSAKGHPNLSTFLSKPQIQLDQKMLMLDSVIHNGMFNPELIDALGEFGVAFVKRLSQTYNASQNRVSIPYPELLPLLFIELNKVNASNTLEEMLIICQEHYLLNLDICDLACKSLNVYIGSKQKKDQGYTRAVAFLDILQSDKYSAGMKMFVLDAMISEKTGGFGSDKGTELVKQLRKNLHSAKSIISQAASIYARGKDILLADVMLETQNKLLSKANKGELKDSEDQIIADCKETSSWSWKLW